MSKRPFMPLYISDFVGDTLRLNTEQIGAYMLILMAMWNAGGSLPNDEVALSRVVRMTPRRWRSMAPSLMSFFILDGKELRHKRLDKELNRAVAVSEARSEAGRRGGRPPQINDLTKKVSNNAKISAPVEQPNLLNLLDKEKPIASSLTRTRDDAHAQRDIHNHSKPLPVGNGVKRDPRKEILQKVLSEKQADDVMELRLRLEKADKRKPFTLRVAEGLVAAYRDVAEKCNMTPDEAADFQTARAWQSIDAEWVLNARHKQPVYGGNNTGHDPGGGDEFEQYARRLREEERRNASNK
ncbi:MAG TPA: DUF1376 domain-containing protein [Phyllobacterium sp.]|nr:DUF1376 domain-containing protein [Phyllobacterium sp.]